MQKNILLPGGIGYIGSHVILQLLNHTPYQLTIIDNYLNSSKYNLNKIFLSLQTELEQGKNIQDYKSRVRFHQGNIMDLTFLNQIFAKCREQMAPITTIIHFAAKKSAPESVSQPLDYYENNFVGSMNLIKMMEKYHECKQFIFSSTAAVYGEQDNCTEEFHCNPISPYGQSKLCVDMFLKSMGLTRPDWKIISLRYFNPAGNHQSGIIGDNPIGNIPGNLFSIIQQVIIGKRQQLTVFGSDYKTTDGTGVRDYVHVTDLAVGHLKALQYMQTMTERYNVFNFGSGTGYSVLQVIKEFSQLLKAQLRYKLGPRRQGDLQRLVTASTKAQKTLGWKTQKSLKDMCESCIKFTVTLRELNRRTNECL